MSSLKYLTVLLPISMFATMPVDSEQLSVDSVQPQVQKSLTEAQKDTVKNIIVRTIESSPKVILQELADLKQHKLNHEQQYDTGLINEHYSELFDQNNDLAFGNPKADVTIVEFIDYSCEHCRTLISNLQTTINSNSNIKLIIKELPILGLESTYAAKAVLAAKKQGKYLKFQNYLLTTKNDFSQENLIKAADILGLNLEIFKQDLNSKALTLYLDKNAELAKSMAINGTPTVVISGKNSGKIILGKLSQRQIDQAISSVS